MMGLGFSFNGIHTSSMDLGARSVKRPLLPNAKVKRLEVLGASGMFDFPDSEYESREIVMKVTFMGKGAWPTNFNDMREKARLIANWLAQDDFCRLIMDDEPDKYYLAKVTNELDMETFYETGIVEIQFDCQPFALSIEEEVFTYESPLESGLPWFVNPGTRAITPGSPIGSKSIVRIEGSWTQLGFNSNWHDGKEGSNIFTNTPGSGVLEIDNIEMTITLNGDNWFEEFFNGEYGAIDRLFRILPGNNYILVWDRGTQEPLNVTISYIPLWY